jgi:hypothetical protein
MSAKLISREGKRVTLEVTFDLAGSMLEAEKSILDALNEAGGSPPAKRLNGLTPTVRAWRSGVRNGFPKGRFRKSIRPPTGRWRSPGTCINVPKAARRFVRWSVRRGLW